MHVRRAAPLPEREQRRVRVSEDLLRVILRLVARADDLVAGVDERAEERLVLHDARVVSDVRRSRHAVDEPGEVGRAADLLQIPDTEELLAERLEIDRTARALEELRHRHGQVGWHAAPLQLAVDRRHESGAEALRRGVVV